jgi:glutathione S-transferase
MPVLHHHPLSAASRYVRLVFAEYGEEPALVEEQPWRRSESLLALNPAGTLPILEDDNQIVVSGGTVIAEYLFETRGQRLGEEILMPANAAHRAEARRLVWWFGQKMNSEVTTYLVHEKLIKRIMPVGEGGGAPDSTAIRAARSNIRYHLNYIGWLAERRNWLAGRSLSLADLAAAAELSCIDYLGEVPWEEDEKAKAWYARIKSRPSFRPLLADIVRGAPPARDYANLDF